MRARGAALDKTQNVVSSTLVVFSTAIVTSTSGTCTKYYAGGWKDFTNNLEMLPVAYSFRFSDGTSDKQYSIQAGIQNIIH